MDDQGRIAGWQNKGQDYYQNELGVSHSMSPSVHNEQHEMVYLEAIREKYFTLVRRSLQVNTDIPDIKSRKVVGRVDQPKPWSGAKGVLAFDVWIEAVIRWMNIHHLKGISRQPERVTFVGQFITGPAAEWYGDNVDGLGGMDKYWTLIDVIMGQEAADEFNTVKYKDSVQELYQAMLKSANRMIEKPDPYTFKDKYMKKIPRNIREEVLRRGVSAEHSSIRTLVQNAVAVEHMMTRVDTL